MRRGAGTVRPGEEHKSSTDHLRSCAGAAKGRLGRSKHRLLLSMEKVPCATARPQQMRSIVPLPGTQQCGHSPCPQQQPPPFGLTCPPPH